MDANPQPIEVAAGLVFRRGRLLITQRRADAHLAGLWEFPGGKREPNESFEDCLRRELREELGIETEPIELIGELTHAYPDQTVHLKFFRCRHLSGSARPVGCADVRWVRADELGQYEFPAADARLLDRLKDATDWWR